MMMSSNDFIYVYGLKIKATSKIKIQRVVSVLALSDVGIYLGGGPFKTDIGIVHLHPVQSSHWVLCNHECYFDSYCITTPTNLSQIIIERNSNCFSSEFKTQGLTSTKRSFCATYCLYIFYLTEDFGINFKSAVLNLYYRKLSLQK